MLKNRSRPVDHTNIFEDKTTSCMVIKRLRSVLSRIVAKDPSSAEDPETDGTAETFETPDMEEVLRENQTADEL